MHGEAVASWGVTKEVFGAQSSEDEHGLERQVPHGSGSSEHRNISHSSSMRQGLIHAPA